VKLPPPRAQILCSVSKTGALASSARRNVSDAVNSIVSALAQVRRSAVPGACGAPRCAHRADASPLRPLLAAEAAPEVAVWARQANLGTSAFSVQTTSLSVAPDTQYNRRGPDLAHLGSPLSLVQPGWHACVRCALRGSWRAVVR